MKQNTNDLNTPLQEPVLHDVQNTPDTRGIPIAWVGIQNTRRPFVFQDQPFKNSSSLGLQTLDPLHTVGEFSLAVALPALQKGTHMSRFQTLLQQHTRQTLNKDTLLALTDSLKDALHSTRSRLQVTFPYFYTMQAPVSQTMGDNDAQVRFVIERLSEEENSKFFTEIIIPVMTVCPCSKAISLYGAHSQRSVLTLKIHSIDICILDCIQVAYQAASAPLFPILKRTDEKYVTELSYDNPRFVEDLVREAAAGLRAQLSPSCSFSVHGDSFESIHNHNAWAEVFYDSIAGFF